MNPYYVVFLPLINIVLDCISKKHHKLKLIAKMAIMKLLVNAVGYCLNAASAVSGSSLPLVGSVLQHLLVFEQENK